jgi:hypothetical protein
MEVTADQCLRVPFILKQDREKLQGEFSSELAISLFHGSLLRKI